MAETVKEKKEEKEKTVRIKLEKGRHGSEKEDVWVAVNFKSYLIKRGEWVDVPASVAEVLQHKEEQLASLEMFEDSYKNK